MELKNYLKIFAKNWFWLFITAVVVLGLGVGYKQYANSRPTTYVVSLLLNVTRSGIQETDTYRYDDFYRLQADEKFAETVVRWLHSPRLVTDIYNETGIVSGNISLRELSKTFKAKKISSQSIEVNFSSTTSREAQDLSESIVKSLNQEIKDLNQFQKEESWFKIVGDEPVIKEFKVTWRDVLPASIALGLFLGIWVMLIKHYLTKE